MSGANSSPLGPRGKWREVELHVHEVIMHTRLSGQPASQWDNQFFVFKRELVHNRPTTTPWQFDVWGHLWVAYRRVPRLEVSARRDAPPLRRRPCTLSVPLATGGLTKCFVNIWNLFETRGQANNTTINCGGQHYQTILQCCQQHSGLRRGLGLGNVL